jgi:predicted TIM-barrel fold metal-dependent hydrolase
MKPSDTFRSNLWVTPFFEDDVAGLVRLLGAGHVLAGSDYPHPEGLAQPAEFADELTGLAPDVVRKVMRENLAELV